MFGQDGQYIMSRTRSIESQRKERVLLLAKLGWQQSPMTTGELWQTVAELFGIETARKIRQEAIEPCSTSH